MKLAGKLCWTAAAIVFAGLGASPLRAPHLTDAWNPGTTIKIGGRTATVKKLEALPFVDSDYSRRFRFDAFENQKLHELRERYQLDEVIAPGRDEFEKQVLLLDWTHRQFKKFGRPSTNATGALEILRAIRDGHRFFCSQYGELFVSAAASLGWVDRELALRRHRGNAKDGSSEHTTTEIWSNQHHKWVMLDPTANMHILKDGMPLNAYEIRQEWFEHAGTNLVFVIGKEQKRFRKSDLPIFLGRFAGFGDLTVPADELDKYGFIGYIPNTNLMDEREDYGRMFIVKDHFCEGTRWHERTNPAHPATDPYFPIGQVAVNFSVEGSDINVALRTLTPNFKTFQARSDGGAWKPCGESLNWQPHPSSNRLELRTLNKFGVEGPVSTIELDVAN